MKRNITKTLSFLIIFLLTITYFSGISFSNSIENPYGKKSWELSQCSMTVIYQNGSKLETRHTNEQFSFIRSTVIKENQKWAKVRIDWKKDPISLGGYYQNKTIPDYQNLTFRVSKDNNMAYLNRTGDLFGFFPFFIYNYNNTKVLGGEKKKTISLDKEYSLNYITSSEFSYSTKSFRFNKTLQISSSESIEYTMRNEELMTPKKMERHKMSVTCIGKYPIMYDFLIPADYLIKNTTDEKFIRINGMIGSDQEKAVKFLKGVENGPKIGNYYYDKLRLIIIIFLLAIFATTSYLSYRKIKEG